ncbi:MAG: putative 2OG-Fe(II) oxygenase [Paracoccaceae bacterium]
MEEIVGIFPTPLMIARKAVPGDLVDALVKVYGEMTTGSNVRTAKLAHTPMAPPRVHEAFKRTHAQVAPRVKAYGEALMGETLDWGIKEIWVNRMETGGAQKMHNHANSFISGIIYLTPTHPGSATVFYRRVGADTFQMHNENERCKVTAFNTPIFRVPDVGAGDMILFPSYMHHEVPPNQGPARMTAAFNALPDRLDSWGYQVRFK